MKKVVVLIVSMLTALSFAAITYAGKPPPPPPPPSTGYIVVAQPEGGMKCMLKKDYSQMCIMPPGYSLRAQVFKKNADGTTPVVTTGITVKYSIDNNTKSSTKTNFWTYAPNFGWNWAADTGSKGYGLSGNMTLNGKAWEALKVPVTPYLDGQTTETPYQRARVQVYDTATGAKIAETTCVMPQSGEMRCDVCHGGTGGTDTDINILQAHDTKHGTTLATDGKSNLCADCHPDPSIGKTGQAGVSYLSTAMHKSHSGRMSSSPYRRPVCYTCHPGPTVKCYRGEMNSKSCDTSGCHGSMATVGSSTRTPWKDMPRCSNCHQAKYAEPSGVLYKDAMLSNSPSTSMNGQMYCQTCHGAQHAEYGSTLAIDNEQPIALQGVAKPLGYNNKCSVCHATATTGYIHR